MSPPNVLRPRAGPRGYPNRVAVRDRDRGAWLSAGRERYAASGAGLVPRPSDAARTYAWTAALGTLTFAVMAGIIRGLLPQPIGDIFLIGAAAFVVETAVQGVVLGRPGASSEHTSAGDRPDGAGHRQLLGPILTGATTTMIGAVTVLGLRPIR